jgi:Putative serine esterase (DUF676)/Protein FAM135
MSLNAVIEVVMHFESFRNIDLSSSGLYFIRFHLYYLNKAKNAVSVNPIECFGKVENTQIKKTKMDLNEIEPSKLNKEANVMCSRIFAIRYCEEEVEINDFFNLRCEIDIYDNPFNQIFYLDAELLFADAALLKDVENEQPLKLNAKQLSEFNVIAMKKLVINDLAKGISEYAPVIFEKEYYSIAQLMIHSSIIDVRYRASAEYLRDVKVNRENQKAKKYNEALLEKLFGKGFQRNQCEMKIEEFYNFYCKLLKKAYDKISSRFYFVVDKCQSIKENEKNSLSQYFPSFKFPEKLPDSPEMKDKNIDSSVDTSKVLEEDKKPNKTLLNRNDSVCMSDVEENTNFINLPKIKTNADMDVIIPSLLSTNESTDMHYMFSKFLYNITMISGIVQQCWTTFIEATRISPQYICDLLKTEHFHKCKLEYSEFVYRSFTQHNSFEYISDNSLKQTHSIIAKEKRSGPLSLSNEIHVRDDNYIKNIKNFPIVFEEILTIPKTIDKRNYEEFGVHLFVLAHGFQGCQFDMHMVRNNILQIFPESMILCSKDNEEKTDSDIDLQGKTLANEIEGFIMENCPMVVLNKISFIGFSIGGVLIRAALPYLIKYKDKMCNFISFSSPHIGTLASSSHLIDAGMWFLKKLKKSTSLLQISLEDAPHYKDTYLYKLSLTKGLSYFENVILASSHEDQYVPYESSRMEISNKTKIDSTYGPIIREMISNVMNTLQTNTVHRLDVDFVMKEVNFDTFIGRAAHIQFLESDYLMKILLYRYSDNFV